MLPLPEFGCDPLPLQLVSFRHSADEAWGYP